MADLVTELTARAKSLSPEDRARLATELLASLDAPEADAEPTRDALIRQRIDDIEHGAIERIPADQAFAQLRRALAR